MSVNLYAQDVYLQIINETGILSFLDNALKENTSIPLVNKTIGKIIKDKSAGSDNIYYGTFKDPRDGQTYKTVKIGNQTWMAENLNYKTDNSWTYNNNPANGKVYGRLYTWDAAKTACPDGWHLPSDDEWKTLEMFLGMSQSEADNTGFRGTDEGKKMKSTSGWSDNGNGTNSSGFNALPGGGRSSNGSFLNLGDYGYWWSASEDTGTHAWGRGLRYGADQVDRYNTNKVNSFSVRCLKN